MATRQAEIRWSKQYELKDMLNKAPNVATKHYGLYMIIEDIDDGAGKKVIYIGLVKDEKRDLYTRFQEHHKKWLNGVQKNQIWMKFGVVYTQDDLEPQLIEDIESALIFGAQPRENTAKRNSYRLVDDVEVKNINHEGFLAPSYSTAKQRANSADPSWQ